MGEEQNPVRLPRSDRLAGARHRGGADSELPRGVLDVVLIRVDPEAEELRADEADWEEPEEEPVGEPAGDQSAAERQLPLEGDEPGICARHAVPRGRGQLVSALHERGRSRTGRGSRLSDRADPTEALAARVVIDSTFPAPEGGRRGTSEH